jgi:hypothetical protein
MKCDCWLGILSDYHQSDENDLHLNTIIEKLKEESKQSFVMSDILRTRFKGYEPKDYIDRRRGLATLFSFCPVCGTKINWKEIRGSLK